MANLGGRPFTDILGEIHRGDVLTELTQQTYELMQAVMEQRKGGSITLKISVQPTGKGTVSLCPTVTCKKPKEEYPADTFFVDDEFAVHRDDPRQNKLPLHAVEMPDKDNPVQVKK